MWWSQRRHKSVFHCLHEVTLCTTADMVKTTASGHINSKSSKISRNVGVRMCYICSCLWACLIFGRVDANSDIREQENSSIRSVICGYGWMWLSNNWARSGSTVASQVSWWVITWKRNHVVILTWTPLITSPIKKHAEDRHLTNDEVKEDGLPGLTEDEGCARMGQMQRTNFTVYLCLWQIKMEFIRPRRDMTCERDM